MESGVALASSCPMKVAWEGTDSMEEKRIKSQGESCRESM